MYFIALLLYVLCLFAILEIVEDPEMAVEVLRSGTLCFVCGRRVYYTRRIEKAERKYVRPSIGKYGVVIMLNSIDK